MKPTRALSGVLLVAILATAFGIGIIPRNVSAADPDPGKDCLSDLGLDLLFAQIQNRLSKIAEGIPIIGGVLGGLFGGGEDAVKDAELRNLAHKEGLKNCIKYVTDKIAKVALQKFKKRLLDKMTDDVVAWIKDDGSGQPRFVDDFGGFLKDTADESIGQTVEALGFSNLCSGSLTARLQLQLQQPAPFTEQVNCTLTDVVKNVGDFNRDFRAGGWVGYNEVLKPQNNRWGLEILAVDQASKLQAQKAEADRIALNSGGGYTDEKACYEWSRDLRLGDNSVHPQSMRSDNSPNPYGPNGPVWNDNFYDTDAARQGFIPTALPVGAGAVSASTWKCTKEKVTVPGTTVASLTNQALIQPDIQLLANADDLAPYISAIFDASINRLFKEGVKGLRGDSNNLSSESGTGRASETWNNSRDPRDQRYGGYGSEYGTSFDPSAQLKDAISKTIALTTARMRVASSSLLTISSPLPILTPLNNRLIASTTLLVACEKIKIPDPDGLYPDFPCASTETIAKNNTTRANVIQSQLDSLKTLSGQLQQVRTAANDPAISVASLTELVAVVNNVYLSVENIITTIVPSFSFDINTVASSTVNPRLRACQAGPYACSL
ncbi:MAG: hypothetical protein AAB631_02210 [Patescibacteria group bacterium]